MTFDIESPQMSLERFGLAGDISVSEQVHRKSFSGSIEGFESTPLEKARQLLPLAKGFADAPISGFQVGAVAIGGSGRLYLGANQEFVGMPLNASLHAEQSAVLNARCHGESRIEALVVSAAPCGHCRQFLWELPDAGALKIYFDKVGTDLATLLPNSFGQAREVGQSLLDSPEMNLGLSLPHAAALAKRALVASCKCYTPYAMAPEGVALECVNGSVFEGSTIQSVAFNPSVPAIVDALNRRNFSHSRKDGISSVVFASLATSLSSQRSLTKALMRRVSRAELQSVTLELE